MKKLTAMLALATALTLTACSSPAADTADAPEAPPTSAASATSGPSATPEITAAPIAMPTEAATEAPTELYPSGNIGDPEVDEFFLKSVRSAWRGEKPTADQFLSAASLVCEQIAQGVDRTEIQAVAGTGEDADWNNARVIISSTQMYCDQEL